MIPWCGQPSGGGRIKNRTELPERGSGAIASFAPVPLARRSRLGSRRRLGHDATHTTQQGRYILRTTTK